VDTSPPSVPTNLTATAAGSTQINLSWTASTDNVGVVGYQIFRDTVPVDITPSTSYSDTGLTASTAYSYTVIALDAADNVSEDSNVASATTLAPGQTAALNAELVSVHMPIQVARGRRIKVYVVMRNTGTENWTRAGGVALVAADPSNSHVWGVTRVELRSRDIIRPGQTKRFTFAIKAPALVGSYACDWQMIKDPPASALSGVEDADDDDETPGENTTEPHWFGEIVGNIINVVPTGRTLWPKTSRQ